MYKKTFQSEKKPMLRVSTYFKYINKLYGFEK